MDRRKLHKANGQTVGKNKQMSTRARATNRAAHQDAFRELEPETVQKPSRLERMKKWRLERDSKKKQEELAKRKPFVTVVKRGVFLDTTNYTDLNKQRRKKITTKKVNAMQKLTAPQEQNVVKVATQRSNGISVRQTSTKAVATVTNSDRDILSNNFTETVDTLAVPEPSELNTSSAPTDAVNMLAVPVISSELNTTFEMETPAENNPSAERNNFANHSFTSPADAVNTLAVPDNTSQLNTTFEMQQHSSELTSSVGAERPIESTPKSLLNSSLNYVSPFVTIGRGKGSAQKEVKVRESFYKLELSQPQFDSPVVRQNREAAQYFRFQVNDETAKLNQTIDYWAKYKDDNDHVDSVYLDQIDVAIGQSRLLINKKFKQFLGLCDECEKGLSQPPVLPKDLEGFWHMVYMQVENCNERFRKLVTLRDNNFVEIDLLPVKALKRTKHRKVAKKGAASSSGIQKMIEEARLKMKENRITATATTSSNNVGHSYSMTLRQTPGRLALATAQTPKSIIKAKTLGQRNVKSVAFSFLESPSTSKSPRATATPKPRVIKRRASTSGVPTEKQNDSTEVSSSFLTPSYRKATNDKTTASSSGRRSHRRLFSVAEK